MSPDVNLTRHGEGKIVFIGLYIGELVIGRIRPSTKRDNVTQQPQMPVHGKIFALVIELMLSNKIHGKFNEKPGVRFSFSG